jgi:hypothetical protein
MGPQLRERSEKFGVGLAAAAVALITKEGRFRLACEMRDVDYATAPHRPSEAKGFSPAAHFLRNNIDALVNPRTGKRGAAAIDFQFARGVTVLEFDPERLLVHARETRNPRAFVMSMDGAARRTLMALAVMREQFRHAGLARRQNQARQVVER